LVTGKAENAGNVPLYSGIYEAFQRWPWLKDSEGNGMIIFVRLLSYLDFKVAGVFVYSYDSK
jgi:hypothetical protein